MKNTDAGGGDLNEGHDPVTGEILPPTSIDDEEEDGPEEADGEFAGEFADEDDGEPGVDAFVAPADEEISLESLSGDIRDAMLNRYRVATRPWDQMLEHERRELVEGLGMASRDLVRKVVRMITGFEFPRATVMLGDVKIIGGEKSRIEAKITSANIAETREVLGEHVGDMVLMLMVDSERFMAERKKVEIEPDQASLPLDDEDAAAAAEAA